MTGVAFSPDGKALAVAGAQSPDGERIEALLALWEVMTGVRRLAIATASVQPLPDRADLFEILVDLTAVDYLDYGRAEWRTTAATASGFSRGVNRAAPHTLAGDKRFAVVSQLLSITHNERLRLRFLNGCQRAPIGLKVENQDVRIMAIDGQPAEPFAARDGQVVLPPSSRVDVFIDVTGTPGTSSSIMLHDGTAAKPIARLAKR